MFVSEAINQFRKKAKELGAGAWLEGLDDEDLTIMAVNYATSHLGDLLPDQQVYHITSNGTDRLCGTKDVEEPAIHISYADRKLDNGVWCNTCQSIHYHEKRLKAAKVDHG